MSRTRKIILFVVLPALAFCALLCIAVLIVVPRLMSNAIAGVGDPKAAKQVGARIADYTLPPGYEEVLEMDLFTTQLVAIGPTSRRSGTGIMMMQFNTFTPGNYDPKQMEQQMQQAMQQQYGQSGTFQSAGQRTVTIKGQPTTLNLAESTTGTARTRQASGFFTGKSGMVMLMIVGDVSTWDWKMVEDFCASIR